MKEVYIVSAVRTPIGSFGGTLASFSATALGAKAIAGALAQAGITPDAIEEVYMGNVVSAGLGQAPARQAALGAGLPQHVACTTVNKVCASGLKSVMIGAQTIALGQADVIVAGGMESMSNIPFYVPGARWGMKYGNGALLDGLVVDGLTDVYAQTAMGVSADATAEKYGISRETQDDFAIKSYQKAQQATEAGLFKDEIVAVEIAQKKGPAVLMDIDEEPYRVDRMLVQLRNARILGRSAAILAGQFTDCVPKDKSKPSLTVDQLLSEVADIARRPLLAHLPFGHENPKMTIPLGIRARVDAGARQIELLEPAVS